MILLTRLSFSVQTSDIYYQFWTPKVCLKSSQAECFILLVPGSQVPTSHTQEPP